MDAPTIEPCPTCGQRVHVESNGSYRQIAELQYRSAESQKHRLESFLVHLMDLTLLGKKRDYRSAMMDVHSRIYRHIGYQRWWIEHRQIDEDEEDQMGCPYGHTHCRGRGFCGIERWGWRDRRRLVKAVWVDDDDIATPVDGEWDEVIFTRPWQRR